MSENQIVACEKQYNSLPQLKSNEEVRNNFFKGIHTFESRQKQQQNRQNQEEKLGKNIMMEIDDLSYIDDDGDDVEVEDKKNTNCYNRSNSLNDMKTDAGMNRKKIASSTPVKLKIVTIKYDSPIVSPSKSNDERQSNDDSILRNKNSDSNVRNEIKKLNKIHSKSGNEDFKLRPISNKISQKLNKISKMNNEKFFEKDKSKSSGDLEINQFDNEFSNKGKRLDPNNTNSNYKDVSFDKNDNEMRDRKNDKQELNKTVDEINNKLGAIPKDSKNNLNKIQKDTNFNVVPKCSNEDERSFNDSTSTNIKSDISVTFDKMVGLNPSDISDISDLDEDPYIELQAYLEKVKREINDVFEEYQTKSSQHLSNDNELFHNMPDEIDFINKNEQISEENFQQIKNISCDDMKNLNILRENAKYNLKNKEVKDVNQWANKILGELDNLVATNEDESKKLKQQKKLMKCIIKPEKRSTIPLQSFSIDKSKEKNNSPDFTKLKSKFELCDKSKFTTPNEIGSKFIKNKNENKKNDTVEVLRIEEGIEVDSGVSSTTSSTINCPTKSSPILVKISKKENAGSCSSSGYSSSSYKKGSSSLWASDESILKAPVCIDDDTKSTTSSSVCDELSGGILSSGKSGNSLDSAEIEKESPPNNANRNKPPKISNILMQNSSPSPPPSIEAVKKMKFLRDNSVLTKSNLDNINLIETLNPYDVVKSGENERQNLLNKTSTPNVYHKVNIGPTQNEINDELMQQQVILRKKPENIKLNEKNRCALTASLPLKNSRTIKARSYVIELKKFSTSNKDIIKYSGSKDSIVDSIDTLENDSFSQDTKLLTNINEIPTQSSASLHSGYDNLSDMIELTAKSNSAPLLMKDTKSKTDENVFGDNKNTLRYSRSQSDRHLAEIEAIEACKWLRAAGFPQYAQMYEDLQFPIDLSNVAKDHPILENDPLQSLYRRLCILNRCAALRLDTAYHHKPQQNQDDSDDENFALSDQWTFQPQIRRWSRIGEIGLDINKQTSTDKIDSSSKESSPERFDDDDEFDSRLYSNMPQHSSDSSRTDSDSITRLKRTGSERLKDGAKALLRRVESIKTRKKKRQYRDGFVMSGGTGNRTHRTPVLELPLDPTKLTIPGSNDKKNSINIIYSTPPSPSAVSPIHYYPRTTNIVGNDLKASTIDNSNMFLHPNRFSPKHVAVTPRSCHSSRTSPLHFFASHMPHLKEGVSDDSAAYMSDSQDSNADDRLTDKKKLSRPRRFLQKCKVDDIGAHSDSECHATACRKFVVKELSSTTEKTSNKNKKIARGGSLNLGKESKTYRDKLQNRSFRSRGSSLKKKTDENDETRTKKSVVRWHSFQKHEKPVLIFKKCISPTSETSVIDGTLFASMSCGQLEMVRKLALVTLTGYMERYCPSHRTGWNWELPKFIKKIKAPDYKDKKIFGVPLVLILQRTGNTLPIGISAALNWLRKTALDQVGIFRKSGVKSRILKLKELIESVHSSEECWNILRNQQAFDIADVLKQYFREIPDSLLTAKMSETFVAIFQHLPQEVRTDAVQAAVLLLPDENRDVLFSLLTFLHEVAKNSKLNQMTASNLAVCLSPSLFNGNIATGNPMTVSPRRRKLGQPNMKELAEAKASHECLTLMIEEYKKIFSASREKLQKCNFGYMEESKPVPLEQLGEGMQYYNWRGYLYECTTATIKEGREKSRGWVAINSLDSNIEIAYKKVGDGHLLRLWRCITEVEGPPSDVLNFILRERHVWDNNLKHSEVVKKLDDKTEIFYYSLDGPLETDFCVLRSWMINNLPKQACVVVETSIDHRDAPQKPENIHGVVLASRYLIEPCGSGRSRVMHLSRIDLKGKRPEWYNKNYGHLCSQYLANIRSAFKYTAEGPESKV